MKMDLSNLGEYAKGELGVVKAESKTAANGPYAMLTLTDGERTIIGKRWKYDGPLPEIGCVLDIIAEVGEFKGAKDLNIKRWSPGTTDPDEFLKKGPIKPTCLLDEAFAIISSIEHEGLQKVVETIYRDRQADILAQPAAKTVHHDYKGGFLQHTIEVASVAFSIAESMTQVSMIKFHNDLILAGALLHDIGKLDTYVMQGVAIEMTDEGQFLEHIMIGSMYVRDVCREVGLDKESTNLLLHCIASHHLELEWGSPVRPTIPEAFIIHMADNISAKCTIMNEATKICDNKWTEKNYFLGTRIYKGE